MASDRIDIELIDKIAPAIDKKLLAIAKGAVTAAQSIDRVQKSIKRIDTGNLTKVVNASAKIVNAVARETNANARLITSQIRAAESTRKLATVNNQTAITQQRLTQATAQTVVRQNQAIMSSRRLAAATIRLSDTKVRSIALAKRQAAGLLATGRAARSAGGGMFTFVRSMAAFVGLGFTISAFVRIADGATVLSNKLRNVTDSQAQNNAVLGELFGVANRARAGVQAVTQSFARFDLALKGLGGSQKESLRLTETIAKSLTLAGATASESAAALLQLSQAFNKGKLDGDEFRTVMELMPPVIGAITKSLGINKSALFAMSEQGQITVAILRKALAEYADEVDSKFSTVNLTIGQSLTLLGNKATELFATLNNSIGLVDGFATAVIFMADNLKIATVAAIGLGSAMLVGFSKKILLAINAATGAVIKFTIALASNPIGLVLVILSTLVAAFVLFKNDIIIVSDGMVSLGDIVSASFDIIKEVVTLVIELFTHFAGPILNDLGRAFSILGKNFSKFGIFILENVKRTINTYVAVFVGAKDAISIVWDNLGGVLELVVKTAANSAIASVEFMINHILSSINTLINQVNLLASLVSGLSVIKLPTIPKLQLGRLKLTDSAADAGADIAKAFKDAFERDFVNDFGISLLATFKRTVGVFTAGINEVIRRAREKSAERRGGELRGETDGPGTGPDSDTSKAFARIQRQLDRNTLAFDKGTISAKIFFQTMLKLEAQAANLRISRGYEKFGDSIRSALGNGVIFLQQIEKINTAFESERIAIQLSGSALIAHNKTLATTNSLRKEGIVATEGTISIINEHILKQEQIIAQERLVANIRNNSIDTLQALTDKTRAYNQVLADGDISANAHRLALISLRLEAANLQLQMGDGTFADAFLSALGRMTNGFQSAMQMMSDAMAGFGTSMINGFANSVGRAIVFAEDLEDALISVARNALSELISSMVKLLIQQAINAAASQSLAAAATAVTVAEMATISAAAAPAAAGVSLASFGANAVPAIAGITTTHAVAQAASKVGFRDGGFTGNGATGSQAGVVHGQEFVVNAKATRNNRAVLEAMNNGSRMRGGPGTASGINVTVINNTPANIEVQRVGPNDVRIIAREEARAVVASEAPGVIAKDLANPNGRTSKALGRNTRTERRL